ncbi:MAG: metallophosphoesterase [Lachnospiraceae bacterium]|nr:metallophosphoesterase [Lachnospiraceae bacterium]
MPFFFFMVVTLMLIFLAFSATFYLKLIPKKPLLRIFVVAGLVIINIGTIYYMVNGTSETDGFIFRTGMFFATVCFIINIYSAIFYVLSLIVRLVFRIIKKREVKFYKYLVSKSYRLSVLGFTMLLGIAGYISMSIVNVYDYEVYTDKLQTGEVYSFAVITDMHMSTGVYAGRVDDLFEKINDTNADAVLFVGDIADNKTSKGAFDELRKALGTLKAPLGAFYVDGNHDGSGKQNMRVLMRNAGVNVLSDEKYELTPEITIYGRNDPHSFRSIKTKIPDDLSEEKFNLIMTHQPVNLADFAAAGGDLSVSGHTHGEQFPLMYPVIASSNDAVMGHTQIDGMDVIVSRGVGGWGLHFSLPSPKEIALVHVIGK